MRIFLGPTGVGKSYLALLLAVMAYASNWIVLYISDASALTRGTEEALSKEICRRFLALNRDVLPGSFLEKLVKNSRGTSSIATSFVNALWEQLKKNNYPYLMVVDNHGAFFDTIPAMPIRFPVLNPLMDLNFWSSDPAAHVVLAGISNAKFERNYLENGMQQWVEFVESFPADMFDRLLALHPLLSNARNAWPKIKGIVNNVPGELNSLDLYINDVNAASGYITLDNLDRFLDAFCGVRSNTFLIATRTHLRKLDHASLLECRDSISNMLLRSQTLHPAVFDGDFLDTGLVYRSKDQHNNVIYKAVCPAAANALIEVYKKLPLPKDVSVASLLSGSLAGDRFEDIFFQQMLNHPNVSLRTTDLNEGHPSIITFGFPFCTILERTPTRIPLGNALLPSDYLAPLPSHREHLIRGYPNYPQLDFIFRRMSIQVSISAFDVHNTDIASIDNAFLPYRDDPNGRNQIEIYLDAVYGPRHIARVVNGRFVVTQTTDQGTQRVQDFCIVYVCGEKEKGKRPGPHHPGLVQQYKDLMFVSFEELKNKLFGDFLQ
ncbi:hypothetical protein BGX26_004660 [Mortierella sp. AD094]|nr:hypothetical protein BGX26_004660 [Mortierella sp. AD094]